MMRHDFFRRSATLARTPKTSGEVIEIANEVFKEGDTAETLKQKIFQRHKDKYGSPIIVAILLKVIVPIVVQLLLDWWSNK